jgi:hypothetical protein
MFVVNKIAKYFVNRTDQENEVYPEFSYSELSGVYLIVFYIVTVMFTISLSLKYIKLVYMYRYYTLINIWTIYILVQFLFGSWRNNLNQVIHTG